MPITVEWGNEAQTILLITYHDPLSVDEIAQAQDEQAAALDGLSHPVTFIINMLNMKDLPANLLTSLPRMGQHRVINHPNLALLIGVVDDFFLQRLSEIFSRVFRKTRAVRTLDEAYRLAEAELQARAS